jgi:glutathione S-transferase/mannose-6-phosphate isomerase-like protein (cupin superfamily)
VLKIYHVPGTRAVRVVWLCEELEMAYERVPVDFSSEYRASAEWRRLNPVGKVPVMTDGDLILFESGAMVEYILDRYGQGRLRPERGSAAHARYLQWSWFAEATFARPLGEIVNHRRVFGEQSSARMLDEMRERARSCIAAIEAALDGQDYLVDGEFTAADIMMGYSVFLAQWVNAMDEGEFPNVTDYFARLRARQLPEPLVPCGHPGPVRPARGVIPHLFRRTSMPQLIDCPAVVEAAGNRPKRIEEFVGRVRSGHDTVSVARMVSPAGWEEPAQTPEFEEITIVLRGTLRVEYNSRSLEVEAGQAVVARPGETVRYSTPGEDGAEYVAVCLPAFSPDSAHRRQT